MKKFYLFAVAASSLLASFSASAKEADNSFMKYPDAAVVVNGNMFKGESINQLPAEISSRIQNVPVKMAPARSAKSLTSLSDGEPVSVTFEALTPGSKYLYNGGIFLVNGNDYATVWCDEENPITVDIAAGTYDLFCVFYSGSWNEPIFYVDYQEDVVIADGGKVTVTPDNATELITCDYKLFNGESIVPNISTDNGESFDIEGNVGGTIYWLGLNHPAIGLLTNMTAYSEYLFTENISPNTVASLMVSKGTHNPMTFYQCFIAFDEDNIMGSGCEFSDINNAVTKEVTGESYQEMDIPFDYSPTGAAIDPRVYSPGFYMTPVLQGKYISNFSFSCHATTCSMEHRYFSFPESNDLNGSYFAYNPSIIDTEYQMWGNLYFLRPSIGAPVMPVNGQMTMISHLADTPFNHDIESDSFPVNYLHPEFAWPLENCTETLGNTAPICLFYAKADDYLEIYRNYRGMQNEVRWSDLDGQEIYVKYDGDVVCDNAEELEEWAEGDWCLEDNIGVYEFNFYNGNVAVDGIPGYNNTYAYQDLTKENYSAPTLTRLAFKNNNGVITNRFSDGNMGTMMFSGADFSFEYYFNNGFYWGFIPYDMTVKVEYAPYASEEFEELEVMENESLARDSYGNFYTVSLAGVKAASDNGWYTLRFTLTDCDGNYMVQELTPAFKIDSSIDDPTLSPTGVQTLTTLPSSPATYYNLQGVQVMNPEKGFYISVSEGKAKKIFIK